MTLLEAVESLGLIEQDAVSCIHAVPRRLYHVAFFTIAFLLPFLDTDLSDEYQTGEPRLWPDQVRELESESPIEDQIFELHESRALGNLSQFYSRGLWTIKTHAGSDQERLNWIEAVIALEGRTPVRDV